MFEWLKTLVKGKYLDWDEYQDRIHKKELNQWETDVKKENIRNFSS